MNPNNYLDIELGGKVRTLYYGINSLDVFMKEEGLEDVNEIEKGLKRLSGIRSMVYALCYVGDKLKNNDIDYNTFTVGTWLDEVGEDTLSKIMDKFTTAHMMGKNQAHQKKGQKTKK